jgi:hypothetical protein
MAQGQARLLDLLQHGAVDIAIARLICHQIPQMVVIQHHHLRAGGSARI